MGGKNLRRIILFNLNISSPLNPTAPVTINVTDSVAVSETVSVPVKAITEYTDSTIFPVQIKFTVIFAATETVVFLFLILKNVKENLR